MTTENDGTIPQPLTAIQLRQMEVDAYTQNIAVYEHILSTINGTWDEDLLPFKHLEGQESAKACPFDRVERLAELQHYENISKLIKTEMFERVKSKAILDALVALE
jgi:hypothetical protein